MESFKKIENLTVSGEYDVAVAGGGPAGVVAALAAARRGLKTIVLEQHNCLGGVATAGGHGHYCLFSSWSSSERVVGGITWEAFVRLNKAGYGTLSNSSSDFEVEGLKLEYDKMAQECGLNILYHTFLSDVIVKDGKLDGFIIQNKSGRSVIKAKRYIDCTGDGDVAARAGCAYEQGNAEGNCQPVTLMFTIGGVEWDRVCKFRKSYGLQDVWKEAQEKGDMRPFQHSLMGWWWTPTCPSFVGVNFTHVNYIDATKAEDLTKATIEARKQAYESIEVFRKYIPGMEKCFMVSTPNTIGIRETRRIHGLYTLTKEDVMSRREFPDSIGYGSFFIDIHGTKGPGMDTRTWQPPAGFHYQIPYRILVPKDIDNLYVAGRCVSVDHEALGSLRVMPQCGVMGEAAGVGAALSISEGVSPKDLPLAKLQAALRAQACIIIAEDIAKANAS